MTDTAPIIFAIHRPKLTTSSKLRLFWYFLTHIKKAWGVYQDKIVKDELTRQRYEALLKEGFIEQPDFYLDNPAKYPGSAIMYAQKYNLELWTGIARSQIKAVLPEELWKRKPETIGHGWVDRDSLQEAVCDCLLACRKDGLL